MTLDTTEASATPLVDAAQRKLHEWIKRSIEAMTRGSHLDSDDPQPMDGFDVARALELQLRAMPWRAVHVSVPDSRD